jgi:hypothetical protein
VHPVEVTTVSDVRHKARPASHSLADTASGDPFIVQAVGDIAANAAAAGAIDAVIDAVIDDARQADPDALAELSLTAAKAQLVAERLTLAAAERLFDTRGSVGHRPQTKPGPALATHPHRGKP